VKAHWHWQQGHSKHKLDIVYARVLEFISEWIAMEFVEECYCWIGFRWAELQI
jgi:hypothetical protein